ncbi:uncharacterized protein K02A2.6-like [Ischnura elegans]|uniref:uncharacterized protein K02A2.6-like n=1 Tax=Ischnura elegans TaxID=197161 RepID=UPI001ED8B3AD|nr:uncharacterized protein K02A2.6-like [Ischnura elegans]
MKSLARSYIWWPNVDRDLEELARACEACLTNKPSPCIAPLKCWKWPDRPWERLHIDLAGPFLQKMFLIVIDSSTKWPEVKEIRNSSSDEVIMHLRDIFATFGLPEKIVSDNGSAFTSSLFREFCKENGIQHIFSPPYHPASNGAAENMVRVFKNKVKTLISDGTPLHVALPRFLFNYRITPHMTTGEPPSVLMFGRALRSRLAMTKPSIGQQVHKKQDAQMQAHSDSRLRVLSEGQRVMTKMYPQGKIVWMSGVLKEVLGSRLYTVLTDEGVVIHRHIDQLRQRGDQCEGKDMGKQDGPEKAFEPEGTGCEELVPQVAECEEDEAPRYWEPLAHREQVPEVEPPRVEVSRRYPQRMRKSRTILDL